MSTENVNRKYRSIALVDLSYLFKRNFVVAPDGPPRDAALRTLKELQSIRESCDHTILCLDWPPYLRKKLYPAYKAKRPEPLPQEREQKRWLYKECERLGYPMARSEGHEADDVIATLAHQFAEWCADVRLYTNDKDAAQCVNDQCIQFIPRVGDRKEERRDALKVKVKFGVYPPQIPLFLALTGDATDNVPGVPGIGPTKGAQLVTQHRTLVGIAEALAAGGQKGAIWTSLANNWENLKLSLDLVTLVRDVPLDVEALLERRAPTLDDTSQNMDVSFDVGLDGFVGNQTPPPQNGNDDVPSDDEVTSADFVAADYERPADRAAREQQERERFELERQRAVDAAIAGPAQRPAVTEAEFIPFGEQKAPAPAPAPAKPPQAPPPAAAAPPPPKAAPAPAAPPAQGKPGIVKAPADYGLVTQDLQPLDLKSARTVCEWLDSGGLYPQFQGAATIFTVIVRGKELGLGMTTALSAFHVIEGKPSASADLIRALAMRDPDCEYFYCKRTSSTEATWVTKHKRNPEPQEYTYTLAEAEQAGLVVPSRTGKPSNWMTRPRDMLAKTAGSKLARLVYPAATLGLYCPEELPTEHQEAA